MAHMKFNEKQIFWALIAGCFLVAGWMGNLALSDLSARSRKNASEVKLAEAEYRKYLLLRQSKEEVSSEYQRFAPYLAIDDMPPRQVVENLLREIERIGRDTAVSVVNLTPQNTPEPGAARKEFKADLRIECQGTERLLAFLNAIELSKLLIKIDKINVSAKDDLGTGLKVEISLSLVTEPR